MPSLNATQAPAVVDHYTHQASRLPQPGPRCLDTSHQRPGPPKRKRDSLGTATAEQHTCAHCRHTSNCGRAGHQRGSCSSTPAGQPDDGILPRIKIPSCYQQRGSSQTQATSGAPPEQQQDTDGTPTRHRRGTGSWASGTCKPGVAGHQITADGIITTQLTAAQPHMNVVWCCSN